MKKCCDLIVGAKSIAYELGVSTDTVRRMLRSGKLPAYKLNGRTSPLRMTRAEADKLIKRG